MLWHSFVYFYETKRKYTMADAQIEKKWNHDQKKLLLTTRLRNEPDFCAKRKKRTVLWEKVLREIKQVDDTFPFSRDDITRKFLNFCVTYKRIKKRNNTSGEAATTWDFFEEMDEVYGSRSDISVPASTLESSLYDIFTDTQVDPPQVVMSSEEPATKKKKCEILEFLQQQACCDKESIQKMVEIEEKKLDVEKQKLEEMRSLRILLSEVINKK